MKIGESVKGRDLVLSEKDLLVMEGPDPTIHVVCDGRICRPDSTDGRPDRGAVYWTKVGTCSRYEDYAIDVAGLSGRTCSKCVKALRRNGIVLWKERAGKIAGSHPDCGSSECSLPGI
jgi:hypothetical protein